MGRRSGARRARGFLRRLLLELEGWVAPIPWLDEPLTRRHLRALKRMWADEDRRRKLHGALGEGRPSRYSQNDEDAILEEIFTRVGAGDRFFVEIGASDGAENCTRNLAEQGWKGVWIEADPLAAQRARRLALPNVLVLTAAATPTNVRNLLDSAGVPASPDLVVIDIDGNDWWVLDSLLQAVTPRVLVTEYNSTFLPGQHWRRRYLTNGLWDRTFRYGASLDALWDLAKRADLQLVGCDRNGVNAFFVQAKTLGDGLEHQVGSPTDHYRAPWFSALPFGHPRCRRALRPMLPLSPTELRHVGLSQGRRLEADGPVAPGEPVFIRALLRNGTDVPLTSGSPAAVNLALRWHDRSGRPVEPLPGRVHLPRPVPPRGECAITLWAHAPATTDLYLLEVTLVQEGVAWLTDLRSDEASVSVAIEVVEPTG